VLRCLDLFTKPNNIYCESSSPTIKRHSSLFNLHLFFIRMKISFKHSHKNTKHRVTLNLLSRDMIIRLTYHMCPICTKASSTSLSPSPYSMSHRPLNTPHSAFHMLALYVAVFGSATIIASFFTGVLKAAICEYRLLMVKY